MPPRRSERLAPPATSTSTATPIPSLSTLPLEIISRILHYLPHSAVPSVARVCRALTLPAEPHIWAEIDLTVRSPFNDPLDDRRGHSETRYMEKHGEAIAAYHRSSRSRVDLITQISTAKRLRALRTLQVRPSKGASLQPTVELLAKVAPNLSNLIISTPISIEQRDMGADDAQSIDTCIFEYAKASAIPTGIPSWSFPHLTNITIGPNSLLFIGFIPLLCRWAPNIITLAVSVSSGDLPKSGPTLLHIPSTVDHPTKIRHLMLDFEDHSDDRSSFTGMDTSNGRILGCRSTLVSLVRSSPRLARLAIRHDAYLNMTEGWQYVSAFLGPIQSLRKLKDLYWQDTVWIQSINEADQQGLRLESGRRLVMDSSSWGYEPSLPIPSSPHLEIAHFKQTYRWSRPDSPTKSSTATGLSPGLAQWLRDCPRLHTMNFFTHTLDPCANVDVFPFLDELEITGEPTCRIRSFQHRGSEELLIFSVLLQDVDIVDTRAPSGVRRTTVAFTQAKDCPTEKLIARVYPPVAHLCSDFGGLAVPLEVIEEMREVDGGTHGADQDVRGREMGEEAWEILMNWKRGVDAEAAEQ